MNMRLRITFLTLVIAIAISGCGSGEQPGTNMNTGVSNTNAASPGANSGLETNKQPEAATTNDAPTLAPVVHAYYDGLKKNDAAAVKAVMERDFLASTEADMKAEKKTDIVVFLTEFDKLPENKMEVRNEKITGTTGVAEVKGGSYAGWRPIVFINEIPTWLRSVHKALP
jgi:hypothetical protein